MVENFFPCIFLLGSWFKVPFFFLFFFFFIWSWLIKVFFPQVRFLHGPVVSTHCWTPPMPRTTFPSSPLSLSTSPRRGPRTTLTSSCWSSCSQVKCTLSIFNTNQAPCSVSILTYHLFPYSWSLLLFQQSVGYQDLHHHVWCHQHVLLSGHGMFYTPGNLLESDLLVNMMLFGFVTFQPCNQYNGQSRL